MHSALAQQMDQASGIGGADGEEAGAPILRHRLDVCDRTRDVERLELPSQQGHLSAVDLPQAIRRQPLLLVEGEDGRRPFGVTLTSLQLRANLLQV